MTGSPDLLRLPPVQRAQLIYATARNGTDETLWRSLMSADLPAAPTPAHAGRGSRLLDLDLDALLGPAASSPTALPEALPGESLRVAAPGSVSGLGPNSRHAPAIAAAAERTGIPPAALAAIVDAESGKRADGSWNEMSRNPRSSAAGLGQFLSGTWIGEAQRPGTWLNQTARASGWLDEQNRVLPGARGALLSLRYDAAAAIEATADYAASNLQRLERAGVRADGSSDKIARTIYLAHHLGPGDAARFLAGGLPADRAAHLLAAQVGTAGASRRIAQAGCPATAHREWLLGYVERHVRPDRFTV